MDPEHWLLASLLLLAPLLLLTSVIFLLPLLLPTPLLPMFYSSFDFLLLLLASLLTIFWQAGVCWPT
jgi:hypothetical protein